MSLDIKLVNENLISYTRTTDALKAFENSATSGQSRLALEVLVEVIKGLVSEIDRLNDIIEKSNTAIQTKSDIDSEKLKPKTKATTELKEANTEV